jgi:RNA polymerase sigma factor (sigma-70 family)
MTPLLSTPLLRTQSDRRLATLAADGHDRAFEAIVERYRRPLQRYLRRLLSEALAEDVLQASFVRAWQALRAGTEVRDLRPWLYRIAHNQALNTLRAAGSALPAATEALPGVSLEAEVEQREELRETLHGIRALPERQRAALVAVAVADRSHADVAAELGMSDGALRQLLLRARTTLRAAATALTPYPLMTWLAGGQEATATRVAEMAVGAGGAGVAIKAGAAVLAAGAVVASAPALRDEHAPARAKDAAPVSTHAHRAAAARPAVAVVRAPTATVVDHFSRSERSGSGGASNASTGSSNGQSGSGNEKRASSHRSGSSGPGSGGSVTDDSGSGDESSDSSGSSGPSVKSDSSGKSGSSGKGDSGDELDDGGTVSHGGESGTSGPGKGESPSSGHGSEPDDEPHVVQPAPEEPSHSGEGGEGPAPGGD